MTYCESISPYPVIPGGDRFARRVWWRGFELVPGVSIRTTVRLRPSLARLQDKPWEMLAAVCRAASGGLALHPKLNFYTFWGSLVWAGSPPRVGAVLEMPDMSCEMVTLAGAHQMDQRGVVQALRAGSIPQPPRGLSARLREMMPLTTYAVERLSGYHQRRYKAGTPVMFVSMLGLPEVEDLTFTPAHSMALYPSWPRDGLMRLGLCFNHQLANARPVGRLLLCIKELLEA